jgi:hypothetical protein
MQVYLLSPNYQTSAEKLQELSPVRLACQIKECMQVIAYASNKFGYKIPITINNKPYKIEGPHKNHIICRYIYEDHQRFIDLIQYTRHLSKVFLRTRGKIHGSSKSLLQWEEDNNFDQPLEFFAKSDFKYFGSYDVEGNNLYEKYVNYIKSKLN